MLEVVLVESVFQSLNLENLPFLTIVNLEGVTGASYEGLELLNKKLELLIENNAILSNCENTDIIGRVLTNSFESKIPTKLFLSTLEDSNRLS